MDEEDRGRLLAVGRVQTSHGVKGTIKVKTLSGEIEHLLRLKSVHLGSPGALTLFQVEHVRPAAGAVLLKLAGIDSPENAAEYRGQLIWVERRFASPTEAMAALDAGKIALHQPIKVRLTARCSIRRPDA